MSISMCIEKGSKEKHTIHIKALIVSRHKATVQLLASLLKRHGIPYDVADHIDDPQVLKNYDIVLGNLPIIMFEKVQIPYYIQVSLDIPKELRGKELSADELKKYVRFVVFEHVMNFIRWHPWGAFTNVAEYDICFVRDIDMAIEEVYRRLILKKGLIRRQYWEKHYGLPLGGDRDG